MTFAQGSTTGPTAAMADAAVAVLDAAGAVTGWTGHAQRLLGYPAGEVAGTPGALLLDASEDGKAVAADVAERTRTGGDWSGRLKFRHREGRTLSLEVRVSPLTGHGEDGPSGWLVVAANARTNAQAAWNAAVSAAVVTYSPVATVIWDTGLRYLWVNEALESESGIPQDRWVGRTIEEVLGDALDVASFEAVMKEVLRTGSPALGYEYTRRIPSDLDRSHTYSISLYRLERGDGTPLGICGLRSDVTGARRNREHLDTLSEAGKKIGTTLDVMRTAQELADYAVSRLADYVTVDLVDTVPLGGEPLERIGMDNGRIPVFRRAGVSSIHQGTPESLFERAKPVFVPPSSPFTKALGTGRPVMERVLDTTPGNWLDQDPQRAKVIHETGMHSLIIVPMEARGAVLGVVVFVRNDTPTPFDADDLWLATELVARASLSLDNARRYAREADAALALQRHLLPQRLVGSGTVEVDARYLPADMASKVGGDWFDVIHLSGARTALVIGDVVGHGINAAATMGRLRTAVQTLAEMDLPPNELLARLDRTVVRLNQEGAEGLGPAAIGATCLYAVHDPISGRLDIASAGHPPPVIIHPTAGAAIPDIPSGTPLGLGVNSFESAEIELPEGSTVALYTDGLVETRDDDIEAGIDRLADALTPPHAALRELCDAALGSADTSTLTDDATFLVARCHDVSADRVVSYDIPPDLSAVPRARSAVAAQLRNWGLDDLVAKTGLIVDELLTNALTHGAPPVRLRLVFHDVLLCEVFDAGAGAPRPRQSGPPDDNGLGLVIVAHSADSWGFRRTTDGKVVWAALRTRRGTRHDAS
ncbi:ATP-binding SpoIIE family protein phosphatase [Streptomyces sp. NBC_01716]|uniref:ATP-binding SpoIIE family protein phosphatase n=1 Tax=Streptomyces sp. NBC_01716 TaxID=2975917 RepID=UPI002E34C511|nr:SpoIIE family protein phosphatase [Streptomyces sp. NBC_01716]